MKRFMIVVLMLLTISVLLCEINFNYEFILNEQNDIKTFWIDDYENEECLFYLTGDSESYQIMKAATNPISIVENNYPESFTEYQQFIPFELNDSKMFATIVESNSNIFTVKFINRNSLSIIDSLLITDLTYEDDYYEDFWGVNRDNFDIHQITLFEEEYLYLSWEIHIYIPMDWEETISKSALIKIEPEIELQNILNNTGKLVKQIDNSLLVYSHDSQNFMDISGNINTTYRINRIDFEGEISNINQTNIITYNGSINWDEDNTNYNHFPYLERLSNPNFNLENSFFYLNINDEENPYNSLICINDDFEIEYQNTVSPFSYTFFPIVNEEIMICTFADNQFDLYNIADGNYYTSFNAPTGIRKILRKSDNSHILVTSENEIYSLPTNNVPIKDESLTPNYVEISNYPNPFNPTTTISFSVLQDEVGTLEIFNAKGQLVKNFGTFNSGKYLVQWQGKDNSNISVSSGIYFYRLETDSSCNVQKMLLLK